MGKRFRIDDLNQGLLMPPSLHDWLPEAHLARFMADVTEEFNLGSIYRSYEKDGRGMAKLAADRSVGDGTAERLRTPGFSQDLRRGIQDQGDSAHEPTRGAKVGWADRRSDYYQLIERVNYKSQCVFILHILSHPDYSGGDWKR